MEEKSYRYDAFISYRHTPTDMAVAERLQRLLERHRKKDGKNLRIFRDRSELPTSSDLGHDIRTALEQSRFLVVICSPEYQKSHWCMAELDYFRSIHGESNSKILPILVEGEPGDVFPEQLLWEKEKITRPDGTQETIIRSMEPLGADIRAENDRRRLRLLKTEHLRVAAPLLGCGFDDLYQRNLRRRRNQLLAVAGTVATLAVAFSFYSGYMVRQISLRQAQLEQTQRALYANESRRLAGDAWELVEEDLSLAMLLADIALPENLETPERPLEKEAEAALGNAVLNAYIQNPGVQLEKTISLKSGVVRFGGFMSHGKKLIFYDKNYVWIYDGKTGELLNTIPENGYQLDFDPNTLSSTAAGNPCEERIRNMLTERYGDDKQIACTNDGRIYFVYGNDGPRSDTGVQKVKTIVWGAEEETELCTTDGLCFQGGYEGIFYSLKTSGGDILQIFSYDSARLGQVVEDAQLLEVISDSGTLGAVRLDVHEQGLIENLQNRNSPVTVVTDPFINAYRVTPDFRHLLLLEDNYKTLRLYETNSGKILFEMEGTVSYQSASCVDAEGKRIVYAYAEDEDQQSGDWFADIYDVETGKRIQTVQISDCDSLVSRGMEEAVVELSGNFLALSFTNATYLVDLEKPEEYICIESNQPYQCYTYSIPTDQIFQDDGLVIVPGNRGYYFEKIRRINLIYDRNENRTVSFEVPASDYNSFYYDAVSGSLIIGDHGVFSVQRRESGGDFAEVYRIVAQDSAAQLDTVLPACDGKYLVLNGDTQSEIYDIADGTLLYRIPYTGSHTPHFCVMDGILYDAAGKVNATGEIPRYELLDTAGWRNLASVLLTEDGVTRTLTNAEYEQYYIPEEWRKTSE